MNGKVKVTLRDVIGALEGAVIRAKAYQGSGSSDDMVDRMVETLAEELQTSLVQLRYYTKPATEGTLTEGRGGRFELCGHELTCGFPIELYLEDRWEAGRVEYTGSKGYYFYGPGEPALEAGMRGRLRE